MLNLSWNDFGVRQLVKDKGIWGQLGTVVDPYGNVLHYSVQLGACGKGGASRTIEIYHGNNVLLASMAVYETETESDEKLTAKIDEFFKLPFYRQLMGTTKAPRYIRKPTELSEQDEVIKQGLDQMLKDLDKENEIDLSVWQIDSDPPSEGQLIARYTKELEAVLA